MARRLLSFTLLLSLWAVLAGAALAQNPTNGKVIYDNFCSGCHGANPGANKDRILNGKTSNGIFNAWSTYPKRASTLHRIWTSSSTAAASMPAAT